jgi:hypothetical protein
MGELFYCQLVHPMDIVPSYECISEAILINSQGGSQGKWQTPHQKAKQAAWHGSGKIEPGDVGIWATCAKGQERRAREELQSMFEEVSAAPSAEDNQNFASTANVAVVC